LARLQRLRARTASRCASSRHEP